MADNRLVPEWGRSVIWYAIYPLGFSGALHGADGGLRRITAWLDHVIELGCNGLWLGPIFASTSHGYDTVDHLRIDPRLGNDDDFDALVAACQQRGIRLGLDGVFNHVGEDHPFFREALADPGSRYDDWFFIDRDGEATWLNFEGSNNLVRLNHGCPEVADYVEHVMNHWCDRGVDAWRLDAAYAVDPAFWETVLPRVRSAHPDVLTSAEVIHADPANVAIFGSITGYELWKATWSAIKDANFFELDWSLKRHDEFRESCLPMTFLSNHDVTRIASQVGVRGALMAAVIVMSVAGMPAIYYGDEQGMEGIKYDRPGGDDDVRPEMPADPARWQGPAPWMQDAYRALIAMRRRNPWLVDARVTTELLENEHIVYRAEAHGHALRVDLHVGGRIRLTADGEEVYALD